MDINKNTNKGENTIDVSMLAKGIYILRLTTEDKQIYTQKLFIHD